VTEIILPSRLINGSQSAICLSDLMRDRSDEYEHLFHPGQERLGHYYLAPFQRPPVWTEAQSARLIESIHLGIAIGSFVVSICGSHDIKTGLFPYTSEWIIDGQQRMRAIDKYLKDGLRVFLGTSAEHSWNELSRTQQRCFMMTPVSFIVLGRMSEDELRDVYDRLNFGGTAHTEEQRASR
jgi:hypothetical protein